MRYDVTPGLPSYAGGERTLTICEMEAPSVASDLNAHPAHARRETEQTRRKLDGYQRTLWDVPTEVETLLQKHDESMLSEAVANANTEAELTLG